LNGVTKERSPGRIGDGFLFLLEESQNKNWDGCSLFFIRAKDQDIERLKRGGCYEREKQRGKRKQEGAAEKPQREEKSEEGEEEQVGLEEALGVTSSFIYLRCPSIKKLALSNPRTAPAYANLLRQGYRGQEASVGRHGASSYVPPC
jgi:hypothetical protein